MSQVRRGRLGYLLSAGISEDALCRVGVGARSLSLWHETTRRALLGPEQEQHVSQVLLHMTANPRSSVLEAEGKQLKSELELMRKQLSDEMQKREPHEPLPE